MSDAIEMNKNDVFDGCRVFRFLRMPDQHDIVIVHVLDNSDVDTQNRNVFRVDMNGKVIWQITRIDHPGVNWKLKHQFSRKEGLPGCIKPFMYFQLKFPDGTTNMEFKGTEVIKRFPPQLSTDAHAGGRQRGD